MYEGTIIDGKGKCPSWKISVDCKLQSTGGIFTGDCNHDKQGFVDRDVDGSTGELCRGIVGR